MRERVYAACSTARCTYRPVVLVLWVIVVVLIVPFYMFSQHELAPGEDQGVVLRHRPGGAERHPRPDQAVRDEGLRRLPVRPGVRRPSSRSSSRPAASAAWSPSRGASARRAHRAICSRSSVGAVADPRRPDHPVLAAAACRAAATSRSTGDRLDGRARRSSAEYRERSWSGRPSPAACSCSPTPISSSTSRRPRSCSTATSVPLAGRRPQPGRPPTCRRCSAATTSTASASRGAATR